MKLLWYYTLFFSLLAGNVNILFGAVVETEKPAVERYQLNPGDYFSRLPESIIWTMFPSLAPSLQDVSTPEQRLEILRVGSQFALINRRAYDITCNNHYNRILLTEIAARTMQEAETHKKRKRVRNRKIVTGIGSLIALPATAPYLGSKAGEFTGEKFFGALSLKNRFVENVSKNSSDLDPSNPSLKDLFLALKTSKDLGLLKVAGSMFSSNDKTFKYNRAQLIFFCRLPLTIFDMLTTFHDNHSILFFAAATRLADFAQIFVESGAHISIPAFLQSVKHDNVPLLRLFLGHQEQFIPSAELKNPQDIVNTGLYVAASRGKKAVLKLLLEYGADPLATPIKLRLHESEEEKEYRLSALEAAIHYGHWKCMKKLMKRVPPKSKKDDEKILRSI